MSSVLEIEAAIEKLSPAEEYELRQWMLKRAAREDNEDILMPTAHRQRILDVIDS